jgi:predicted GIY-YIG superfamily endonuclease
MPKAKLDYCRCYLLYSKLRNRTYIGYTNTTNRLLKHLGILKGGAKATKSMTDAQEVCFVEPFDKSDALSFERAWKNASRNRCRSKDKVQATIAAAQRLLNPTKSTWKRLSERHKDVKVIINLLH